MHRVEAIANKWDMVCAETPAGAVSLTVFGASGDLACRKLYPSLYQLFQRNLMADGFYLLGCGRSEYSDDRFRDLVSKSLIDAGVEDLTCLAAFLSRMFFCSGAYEDTAFYRRIQKRLMELDNRFAIQGCRVFYLSLPPFLYSVAIDKMRESNLSCPAATGRLQDIRIIVEKPFGNDLRSAEELDSCLHRCFDESQIYRIDHYLGKETVQNLLIFRFTNSIFEPLWNRNFIDHIQITIAESVGVEHRAGYYDQSGAMRDMFQNHLLQLVSLVGMEPPASFEADCIRDEKTKLLRCIRPFIPEQINDRIVAGQYVCGRIEGKPVCGYTEEDGVPPDSKTDTFLAAKLEIDNWRWKGVPFYLRTGKRFARKMTEIVIIFKPVAHSMFASSGLDGFASNTLRFQIQPQEGIYLSLQAKRPGSKLCMSGLELAVDYQKVFGMKMPEAYQRLLLDCFAGDPMLFARQDSVVLSWQIVQPVLDYWKNSNKKLYPYPAGNTAFDAAEELLKKDGRTWQNTV